MRAGTDRRGGANLPGASRLVGWAVAAARAAGRHRVFATLMAIGLVLRVLTQVAYRPALVYIDSDKYLYHSRGADPVGYRLLLWPLQRLGGLGLVAAAQHILGLAIAAALYALLRRRGTARWLAAIATAPVLLDAYQFQAEQTVMPDVMFEALIVAALVILLWRNAPGAWQIAAGGLLLGAAADVRQVGQALILPAVVFAVAASAGWRRRLAHGALAMAAFTLPVLAYLTTVGTVTGNFSLTQRGYIFYGRAAFAADCTTLKIPEDERALCPSRSVASHLGIDGIINDPGGPLLTYVPPPGMSAVSAAESVERAVLKQQPLAVLSSIDRDFVKLFALTRHGSPGDSPISRWQFQTSYPTYPPLITPQYVSQVKPGGGAPAVVKPLASLLRGYQLHGGYTPGPLFAITGLLGIAGALGIGGALGTGDAAGHAGGQRALTRACLLVTVTAAAVLVASDVFEFSWRYQLPAVVTLPVAGALAVTAVTAGSARPRQARRPTLSRADPDAQDLAVPEPARDRI